MDTKKQAKRREIRRYEQAINSLEEPEYRITKSRKRWLLTEAVFADLLDAGGGTVLPVVGDIASPFVFYEYFKWRFYFYNVDASEFLKSGTGGRFGKIATWTFDTVIGFLPGIGDLADLIVASWFFTIYTTIRKIQKRDKKRRKEYKQKVRQYKRLLQHRLQQIERSESQKIKSIRAGSALNSQEKV